ncbi:MAG: TetR/AcrR family transcriptional regulator [Halioglobus sp.]|nr:TetR/AcrR family transcriptional regulator [Halioglobus sp.]
MPAKSKSGGGRGKSKSGTGTSARGKTATSASIARGKQPAKTSTGTTGRRKTAAVKGRAGRPPRLSRDMVLDTSIGLLERYSVEQFTMARVAKALNTVSMALYNYFPSRDALLAAIADHICMQFTMPKPKRTQTWQDTLWQWLWALKKHTDDYPVIVEVMGAEGRYSAGWLRITLTVSRTLYEQGLRGHDLALHAWMFCSNALATIVFEREGSAWRSPISLTELDQLDPDEQDFLIMLRKHHVQLSSEEILDLAFHQLIDNLERALQTPGTAD